MSDDIENTLYVLTRNGNYTKDINANVSLILYLDNQINSGMSVEIAYLDRNWLSYTGFLILQKYKYAMRTFNYLLSDY